MPGSHPAAGTAEAIVWRPATDQVCTFVAPLGLQPPPKGTSITVSGTMNDFVCAIGDPSRIRTKARGSKDEMPSPLGRCDRVRGNRLGSTFMHDVVVT